MDLGIVKVKKKREERRWYVYIAEPVLGLLFIACIATRYAKARLLFLYLKHFL